LSGGGVVVIEGPSLRAPAGSVRERRIAPAPEART